MTDKYYKHYSAEYNKNAQQNIKYPCTVSSDKFYKPSRPSVFKEEIPVENCTCNRKQSSKRHDYHKHYCYKHCFHNVTSYPLFVNSHAIQHQCKPYQCRKHSRTSASQFAERPPCDKILKVPLCIYQRQRHKYHTAYAEKQQIEKPHYRPIPLMLIGIRSLFFLPLPFLPIIPSCFIIFCISSN